MPTDRRRSSLENQLIGWAIDHWGEPVEAFMLRWGDWEFERKCLGAILRRVVRLPGGDDWLYAVVSAVPEELLALAPYVGDVQMPWGPMPGTMGWAAWVRALEHEEALKGRPWDQDAWKDMLAADAALTARLAPALSPEAKPSSYPRLADQSRPQQLFSRP